MIAQAVSGRVRHGLRSNRLKAPPFLATFQRRRPRRRGFEFLGCRRFLTRVERSIRDPLLEVRDDSRFELRPALRHLQAFDFVPQRHEQPALLRSPGSDDRSAIAAFKQPSPEVHRQSAFRRLCRIVALVTVLDQHGPDAGLEEVASIRIPSDTVFSFGSDLNKQKENDSQLRSQRYRKAIHETAPVVTFANGDLGLNQDRQQSRQLFSDGNAHLQGSATTIHSKVIEAFSRRTRLESRQGSFVCESSCGPATLTSPADDYSHHRSLGAKASQRTRPVISRVSFPCLQPDPARRHLRLIWPITGAFRRFRCCLEPNRNRCPV
jgi:hypothetical protein